MYYLMGAPSGTPEYLPEPPSGMPEDPPEGGCRLARQAKHYDSGVDFVRTS